MKFNELRAIAEDHMGARGIYGFCADPEHDVCCHLSLMYTGRKFARYNVYSTGASLTVQQARAMYSNKVHSK
jgi:hypothetical protein